MRISMIDGFRGYFLINMMIVHLNWGLQTTLGRLNHHKLGWVEDAQGFVLLSGFVIGVVYGKKIIVGSSQAATSSLWRRLRKLYFYNLALVAIIATFAALDPKGMSAINTEWESSPFLFAALSALLLDAPRYLDILPMYIFYVAFTPFALSLMHRGCIFEVVAVSAAIWIFAQTGLVELALDFAGSWTGLSGYGIGLGSSFNRMGWQFIYFIGLAAGYLMADSRLDLSFLASRPGRNTFFICIALAALFFIIRLLDLLDDLPKEISIEGVQFLFNRPQLSPLRLVNFLVDTYLVLWLVFQGHQFRITGYLSHALKTVMSWRPLVFLGQHSLQVYTFHIFAFYAIMVGCGDWLDTASELHRSVILILGVASLFIPAWAHKSYYKYRRQIPTKKALTPSKSTR